MKRASIAMAVYNGNKFLKQQIDSIIGQMNKEDELIISVDPCTDDSKAIALEYAFNDKRIRVLEGPGLGVVKNFENALKEAEGEYIFLSDQDDIWLEYKLSRVLDAFGKKDVLAVVHDASVVDEYTGLLSGSFYKGGFYSKIHKNILKNKYTGCCMAVSRRLLEYALPFPKNLPMHDQWLGIVAKSLGKVEYIDTPLIYYRRHERTVTGRSKAGFLKRMKWRICILADLIIIGRRAYGARHKSVDSNIQ